MKVITGLLLAGAVSGADNGKSAEWMEKVSDEQYQAR